MPINTHTFPWICVQRGFINVLSNDYRSHAGFGFAEVRVWWQVCLHSQSIRQVWCAGLHCDWYHVDFLFISLFVISGCVWCVCVCVVVCVLWVCVCVCVCVGVVCCEWLMCVCVCVGVCVCVCVWCVRWVEFFFYFFSVKILKLIKSVKWTC